MLVSKDAGFASLDAIVGEGGYDLCYYDSGPAILYIKANITDCQRQMLELWYQINCHQDNRRFNDL